MINTCPYCGDSLPTHGACCRIPHDLDRFERVYERLSAHQENTFLQDNLLRYLIAYGRRDDHAWQPGF
ncbi:MAG: hypothetical protein H7Z12_04295 [Rhodospirillaceae bacterium]|nr:hypothetical protein [Rhodospirillales bacterium]